MRAKVPFLFSVLLLAGCPQREAPAPIDVDIQDTELCGKMCTHLAALKCEEGESVYDSDKPGPKDVPNTSCEEFCRTSQTRGAFLNPRCVSLAPTCEVIETYRLKNPETCGE